MNPKTGNLYPQEIICKDKNVERVWILEMKHKMMMYALITPWGNESLLVCLFYWDRELHLNLLPDAIPLSMKKWAVALDGTAGKRLPAPQCSCRGLGAAQRGSAHPSAAGGCGLIPIISHWRSRRASWNKEVWRFPKCYLLLVTPQQRSCAHLTLPGAVESLLPVAAGDLSWSRMMTMGAETLPPPPPPPGDTTALCILSLRLWASFCDRNEAALSLLSWQGSRASAARRRHLPGQPYREPGCRTAVVPPRCIPPFCVCSHRRRCREPRRAGGYSVRGPAARRRDRHSLSGARCLPKLPRALSRLAPPARPSWQVSRVPLLPSSPPSLAPLPRRDAGALAIASGREGGRAAGGGRGGAAPRQPAAPALPDRRAAGAAAAAGMSLRSARRWWRRRWRRRRPGSPWLPPAMAGSAPRGPESCRSRRWGEAAAMRKGRSRGDKAAPPPPPRREPGRAVAASAAERRATLLGGGGRKDPEDARAAGAPCREALERVKPGRGAGGGGGEARAGGGRWHGDARPAWRGPAAGGGARRCRLPRPAGLRLPQSRVRGAPGPDRGAPAAAVCGGGRGGECPGGGGRRRFRGEARCCARREGSASGGGGGGLHPASILPRDVGILR